MPMPDESTPEYSAIEARLEALLAAYSVARDGLQSAAQPPITIEGWQEGLATLGLQMADMRGLTGEVSSLLGLPNARQRILVYLLRHVGHVVDGQALAGVSGIAEWARRVRELRVEYGWPIESGVQRPDLRPDQYVLVSAEPDADLAREWQLAKEIRGRADLSGKNRVLEYLKAISPKPADQDQLSYVAKIKSFQRRLRELDEEGWEIRSNIDEPELAAGTYRLVTLKRRPPRARQAIKLRYQILERDNFTCADCGRGRGDPGVRLQVHHICPVHQGGGNDPSNLITLCQDDHAGRHSIVTSEARDELLNS